MFPRRQLSFPVSLLLALLRKKLAEFDASGGEARLVLSRDEITEMTRVFLPSNSNEARLTDQIETHLNKIAELGFIPYIEAGDPDTYVEAKDNREVVDITELNAELASTVAKIDRLRADTDAIVAEIEGEEAGT